jgi:NAD(P)-dependent dehydrogenase (short-subunit alcohol dehydrogenase family)
MAETAPKECSMSTLKDSAIILTGATKGIGRAVALRLAIDGAKLSLCGRNHEEMESLVQQITSAGAPKPHVGLFDIREEEALLDFYMGSKAFFGAPDILINNAGYNSRKAHVWEVGTEEFDAMMAVNLRAPYILMRECVEDMKPHGGHVVNILSTVCHSSNETMGVYTAAKQGLQALTDIFRKEVRAFNIKVSSVYPGGTDTPFREADRPDYMNPESVAEAVYAVLTLPEDLVVHHFTFRPMVEKNF